MYLDYYKLKENPFNVTSDPSFLFLGHAHKEALSHLLYGIKEKKGFLEITGEIGAGKTTLCKALLKKLDPGTKTAFILNSNLSEMQLLQAILEDFGITVQKKSKISFFKGLNDFLLEECRKNSNAVLILDEAQNIKSSTLEGIRLLSNLETDKEKLFQIVLVGQPELREKLNSPELAQLRQRIAVRYHVNPLEKDEVRQYILHRLSVAGGAGDIIFTDEAIEKIFEYSGGIPRLINLACDKALLAGFVAETRSINRDIVEKSVCELEGKPAEVVRV
ncbi:MAG: AAA family ATPase [Candidatus Omnitrophica bacterium]|nr:AAA family ATPase [Candidatus Omnitrophota bacterium]